MTDSGGIFRRMAEKTKLTKREERFIEEYMTDLNGTKAAVRAGFTTNLTSAATKASELLRKTNIAERIAERQAKRIAEAGLNAQYVIDRMLEIDQLDVADIITPEFRLKPLTEWPSAWRRYLNGFEVVEMFAADGEQDGGKKLAGSLKKIKWPDKTKNLELLGRHFGIFNDKLQVTGPGGQPLVIPSTIQIVAGPIDVKPAEPTNSGNDGSSTNTA